jgi:hypothetical protein
VKYIPVLGRTFGTSLDCECTRTYKAMSMAIAIRDSSAAKKLTSDANLINTMKKWPQVSWRGILERTTYSDMNTVSENASPKATTVQPKAVIAQGSPNLG